MKAIYDAYGSKGITIAEQLGEEVSNNYNSYDTIDYITCIGYNLIAFKFDEFTNKCHKS